MQVVLLDIDKKNLTLCRHVNELAWSWAINNADPAVRARFQQNGEPFVMVDDKIAPIGITGPQWIKDTLVYNRVSSADGSSHIEVQSWTFIVGESPIKTKYIPSGMHYCKLLSPARAMEWIYNDGLRRHMPINATIGGKYLAGRATFFHIGSEIKRVASAEPCTRAV